jgi:phage terminase large subunit-like protein
MVDLSSIASAARGNKSLASWLSLQPGKLDEFVRGLTDEQALVLQYEWRKFWARPSQLPPDGDWLVWLLLAGRGFGKTKTGAEWVREQVETGAMRRIALVAPTVQDLRDVMIEGGILACAPPWMRPTYEPSKRHRLTWPNGAVAFGYSAEEPERLRGPQHDGAWCDELAAWKYQETWDMLQFGLRLGTRPRALVTTTPKPIKLLRELLKSDTTKTTRGTTYENRGNLAPSFYSQIVSKYEGTRLGRQELNAELLEDVPGALWNRALLDQLRVRVAPDMKRIVVAIDPATTSGETADESGIIVAGIGANGDGYLLEDLSIRGTPDEVCRMAVKAYRDFHADRIVAEANNGGDWIESLFRVADPNIAYRKITASRGKATRAEPVSSLYEQLRIHHVGSFTALEDQMCAFTEDFDRRAAGYSPDRLDAMVWAFSDLFLGRSFAFTSV